MALIHCDFFSEVLGLSTTMCVILPDRSWQDARGDHKHPTLYLLHGLSDDHTIWQRRTSIERYVQGLDLAVVMPAVHRSFYTDMVQGYPYWTFVSQELPALARSFFPLSAARAENYVAGLSMGGYGALKMALSHPDRYAAAASLSGALDVAGGMRDKDPDWRAEMKRVFGSARQLAGSDNDLFHLAERVAHADGAKPLLYQWCGAEDELYGESVRFRAHAAGLGLPLTYEEGPGAHDWGCWDRQIQRVLDWLPLPGRV
jgi:S-formylglutathione hydrolase FrmB